MGKIGYRNPQDKNNYYIKNRNTKQVVYFRFSPDSISETPGAPEYASESIIGRSTPIITYMSNGARTINYEATFIDDYYKESLLTIRDYLAAMEYPRYSGRMITPPIVTFRLGGLYIEKGVVTSCSFSWTGPIRNGLHIVLKANLVVQETADDALDASKIANGVWRV